MQNAATVPSILIRTLDALLSPSLGWGKDTRPGEAGEKRAAYLRSVALVAAREGVAYVGRRALRSKYLQRRAAFFLAAARKGQQLLSGEGFALSRRDNLGCQCVVDLDSLEM
jgi:hypothetical protein